MGWTGNPSTTDDNGHFATAQESLAVSNEAQNRKAVRVVAGRCIDAADCAEMLAMLGLDAEQALINR